MREAALTDRQKTEKGLYGSCAPRVRGREVTARSKDGSRTKQGGGAAMNSTATELEFTRRRAMRAIVKGLVVGTLGLAVLFGSAGVSLALPPKQVFKCKCRCVAFDVLGGRHEGSLDSVYTYDELSCDIGPKTKCTVGALKLEGTYASCMGPYKLNPAAITPGGTGGVLQPLTPVPPGGGTTPVAPSPGLKQR
jgi:hypothetical protein